MPKPIAFALATLLLATGCNPAFFKTPDLLHPGPIGPQRLDAVYHDPYPLDDVGPEIVGGRPREYQRPVPEVTRGRLVRPQATVVPGPATQPQILQTSPTVVPPPGGFGF